VAHVHFGNAGAQGDAHVHFGNAGAEGDAHRGWFVGHFLPAHEGLRHDDRVEVKWGVHPAGEERPSWVVNAVATTISLLVRGRFRLYFPTTDYLLQDVGDYVLWPPGVPHHWRAEADSIILTVRWPSRPDDSTPAPPPPA
jgi:hypothetical protein